MDCRPNWIGLDDLIESTKHNIYLDYTSTCTKSFGALNLIDYIFGLQIELVESNWIVNR